MPRGPGSCGVHQVEEQSKQRSRFSRDPSLLRAQNKKHVARVPEREDQNGSEHKIERGGQGGIGHARSRNQDAWPTAGLANKESHGENRQCARDGSKQEKRGETYVRKKKKSERRSGDGAG